MAAPRGDGLQHAPGRDKAHHECEHKPGETVSDLTAAASALRNGPFSQKDLLLSRKDLDDSGPLGLRLAIRTQHLWTRSRNASR